MSGLLGSIYSYGNTLQRKLKGLLADPAGTIGLGVTRMGEDQHQLVNLAQDAGYMPGSRSVLATPQQKALARALLAQKGTEMGGAMVGTFIGPGARTWDALANSKAVQMQAAGVDPRVIWKETGNWRAPDGKWRQEIDDSGALFNTRVVDGKKVQTDILRGDNTTDYGPLVGNLLEHKPLQDAYGGVTKSSYIGNKNTMFGDGVQGAYDAPGNSITINAPAKATDAKSTALHELQHAIQQREGFAKGGSPSQFIASSGSLYGTQLTPEAQRIMDGAILPNASMSAAEKEFRQQAAMQEAYRRLAGEAEARATQARMNLDATQRRALFPADSYDVPLDSLIVRYGNEPTNALARALRGR